MARGAMSPWEAGWGLGNRLSRPFQAIREFFYAARNRPSRLTLPILPSPLIVWFHLVSVWATPKTILVLLVFSSWEPQRIHVTLPVLVLGLGLTRRFSN